MSIEFKVGDVVRMKHGKEFKHNHLNAGEILIIKHIDENDELIPYKCVKKSDPTADPMWVNALKVERASSDKELILQNATKVESIEDLTIGDVLYHAEKSMCWLWDGNKARPLKESSMTGLLAKTALKSCYIISNIVTLYGDLMK